MSKEHEIDFWGRIVKQGAVCYAEPISTPSATVSGDALRLPKKLGEDKKVRASDLAGKTGRFVFHFDAEGARKYVSFFSGPVPDNVEKIKVDTATTSEQPVAAAPPVAEQAAEKITSESAAQRTADNFTHPYNFIHLPDHLPHRNRDAVASHAYRSADRHSGQFRCRLTTKTHWFIPHPYKVRTDNSHKTLGYFTLDEVSSSVKNAYEVADDQTKPAIPASSLRGMIRNVFEAVSLSCLSIADLGTLDYRQAIAPEDPPNDESLYGEDVGVRFIPVRVVSKRPDGTRLLRLLRSRLEDDERPRIRIGGQKMDPPVLRGALIGAYPRCPDGTDVWDELNDSGDVRDGAMVVIVVAPGKKTHHSKRGDAKFHYYHTVCARHLSDSADLAAVKTEIEASASIEEGRVVLFGYLRRSGFNMYNKHWERVFFDAQARYNHPEGTDYFEVRLASFLADDAAEETPHSDIAVDSEKYLEASRKVTQNTLSALQGYAKRNGDDAKKQGKPPRPRKGRDVLVSDFVEFKPEKVSIAVGDLFYAFIDKNQPVEDRVRGLSPTGISRMSYDNSIGDLIPDAFYPCSHAHERCLSCTADDLCDECLDRHQHLCPACRVFGWTRELPSALAANRDRVDAVAGHVQFSHGKLVSAWDAGQVTLTELPILGSPKPTTTPFYLRETDDSREQRQSRWPHALRKVAKAFYRTEEAAIRGRKAYRRRDRVVPESSLLQIGGLKNPNNPGNQNQTVTLLPNKLEFTFDIAFDNLSTFELGALLFAIELSIPDTWKPDLSDSDAKLRHAVGHGKPLGMGACDVVIEGVQIDDVVVDSASHIYASVPNFGQQPDSMDSGLPSSIRTRAVQALTDFWASQESAWISESTTDAGPQQTRLDLLEMFNAKPPRGPLHYPPHPPEPGKPGVLFDKQFEWFKKNCPTLPTPQQERSGQRLPYDPKQSPK